MKKLILITSTITSIGCSGNIITAPSQNYYCHEQRSQVSTYRAANPSMDTAMFTTKEGEVVYINWFGAPYHVSGPECIEG